MNINFIIEMLCLVIGAIAIVVGLITLNIWTTFYGFFLMFASSELYIFDMKIRLRKLESGVKQ